MSITAPREPYNKVISPPLHASANRATIQAMNDEQNRTPNENEYDTLPTDNVPDESLSVDLDSLNIDAALAALGSLTDVVAEREAEAAREAARQAALKADAEEREAAERAAAEEMARWKASYHMARPPMVKLGRGRLASVIPGLALMALGAYLTFAYTLGQPPEPALLVGLFAGWSALALLAYWLTAGRWAGGALLGGLLIIGVGGVTAYQMLNGQTFSLPLYTAASGVALLLAGILARPSPPPLSVAGLGMLISSGLWFVLQNNGTLSPALRDGLTTAAPFVLAVMLILLVLPFIFQRRA